MMGEDILLNWRWRKRHAAQDFMAKEGSEIVLSSHPHYFHSICDNVNIVRLYWCSSDVMADHWHIIRHVRRPPKMSSRCIPAISLRTINLTATTNHSCCSCVQTLPTFIGLPSPTCCSILLPLLVIPIQSPAELIVIRCFSVSTVPSSTSQHLDRPI